MTVEQLIKVLQELDPDLDVFYIQNTGIVAPIKSVQECHYRGFKPDYFIGVCCGKSAERDDMIVSPIYISQQPTRNKQPL